MNNEGSIASPYLGRDYLQQVEDCHVEVVVRGLESIITLQQVHCERKSGLGITHNNSKSIITVVGRSRPQPG